MSAEPVQDYEPDDLEVPDYPGDEFDLAEKLDWHLNRMAWYRAKETKAKAQAMRMIARYTEWADRTVEPWQRKIAESEAAVEYLMLTAIDSDPKHPKTLHLPSGTVRSVAPRPSVVVDDIEAFKEWVAQRGEDAATLARWKCEPNKSELSKVLADGEIVSGVRLEPGERRVSISLEADE